MIRPAPGGRRRFTLRGCRRLPAGNRRGNLRRRVAGEGRPAGRHLVQHGADREDVGAVIGSLSGKLFGSEIGVKQRTVGLEAGWRQLPGRWWSTPPASRTAAMSSRGGPPAAPSSSSFTCPSLVMKTFGRFDVAVDQAAAVDRGERVGELRRRCRAAGRRSAACRRSARRAARPSSSSQTRKAWPFSSPESCTAQMCGWLTSEAMWASRRKRSRAWPGQLLRPQQLDRDVAIEPQIAGAIDLGRAVAADPLEELVVGDAHRLNGVQESASTLLSAAGVLCTGGQRVGGEVRVRRPSRVLNSSS